MIDKQKQPSIAPGVRVPVDDKQKLIPSFIAGLQDFSAGESYRSIFGYFFPELISALMLYSLLNIMDAKWIADLKSTSLYATVGVTSNLIHFLTKVAEGLSIGAIVLTGQYNGRAQYTQAGKTLRDVFWMNVCIGGVVAFGLWAGAANVYRWYGMPEDLIALGTPYLRIRAVGIFFMFVYLALVGFLRGVKNTNAPMRIFLAGAGTFLFFDYALIHGAFGFPALGLTGSALASIAQYVVMCVGALAYLKLNDDHRKYAINLRGGISSWACVRRIIVLSWPTIVEKAAFAAAYLWLCSMITPMGTRVIATFSVIKDLERVALLPGIAFAQVVTFLVSNAYSMQDWKGIKSSVKKILFLSTVFVLSLLLLFSLNAKAIIPYFDRKHEFTDFAAGVFPFLSLLVFFDLLQLILAGALRGAANVKTVMMVRVCVLGGVFVPVSYLLSHVQIDDPFTKFLLLYGSFYACSAIMSMIYIYHLRGEKWKGAII